MTILGERRNRRRRLARHGLILLSVGLLIFSPFWGLPHWDVAGAVQVLILSVGAASVTILLGHGGMLSLGQGLFIGVSAYTMGVLVWNSPLGPAPSALIGIGVAVLASVLLGVIFVRVSGIFFTVGTLALAVAFEGLVRALHTITGGASGLAIERSLPFGPWSIDTDLEWYAVAIVVALCTAAALRHLSTGKTRRLLMLLKADQLMASVLGLRIYRLRLSLFVMAATMAAIAGVLQFLWLGAVIPETGGVLGSVALVAQAVVGGISSWAGPFVGTFVLEWLSRAGRFLGSVRELIFGISFLVIVLFAREGLVGLFRKVADLFTPKWLSDGLGTDPLSVPRPEGFYKKAGSRSSADRGKGLHVEGVTKFFGGARVLHDVSLTVPYGRVSALIGSNGAGKSTLLNIISGVEPQTGGRIYIDGYDVDRLSPADRARTGLARTFQVPRLVAGLSALDNVALGNDALSSSVYRRSRSEELSTRSQALKALERDGLGHFADRPAGELGSGERKALELTRSLAWGGNILMMDEPGVGLESDELDALLLRIQAIAAAGAAVLIIDHNMDFIGAIADRVYVLDRGEIVYEGDPEECLAFFGAQEENHVSG